MTTTKEHLLEIADAHDCVGTHLHEIHLLSAKGVPISAERLTACRRDISRALCAATALEQLAKGNPEPQHGH